MKERYWTIMTVTVIVIIMFSAFFGIPYIENHYFAQHTGICIYHLNTPIRNLGIKIYYLNPTGAEHYVAEGNTDRLGCFEQSIYNQSFGSQYYVSYFWNGTSYQDPISVGTILRDDI